VLQILLKLAAARAMMGKEGHAVSSLRRLFVRHRAFGTGRKNIFHTMETRYAYGI
jgi:hypothetical protein